MTHALQPLRQDYDTVLLEIHSADTLLDLHRIVRNLHLAAPPEAIRAHIAQARRAIARRDELVAELAACRADLASRSAPRDLSRFGLTRAESDVLVALLGGASTVAAAAHLHITTGTVRKHLQSCFRKLGVHSRAAAVAAVLGAG